MAAHHLIYEAYNLLQGQEDTSRVREAWQRHALELIGDGKPKAQDAVAEVGIHEREYGYRVGLLVGAMVASRRDGSTVTAADVAGALVEAVAWQDADTREEEFPHGLDHLRDIVPPRGRNWTEEERRRADEGWEIVRSTREAADLAIVGDAVAAATDLWRSLTGGDVETATLEEMLDLARMQQAANLEGRARLRGLFESGTAPEWVWAALRLTQP